MKIATSTTASTSMLSLLFVRPRPNKKTFQKMSPHRRWGYRLEFRSPGNNIWGDGRVVIALDLKSNLSGGGGSNPPRSSFFFFSKKITRWLFFPSSKDHL